MTTAERNKRTRDERTREERTRDECPVCMECIGDEACGGTDGDRVLFPCGHFVCVSCNDGMLRRDDQRCPSCRMPRSGFTREMADARAEQRVVQDMAEEGNPNATRLLATRSLLAGPGGPAAAHDMAPMLRNLVESLSQATGRPRNRTVIFVGTYGNRVHVQQQEGPRSPDRPRDREEEEEEQPRSDAPADRAEATDLEARMPQPLRDLLSALVGPSDLAHFHEVRRRV